MAKRKRDIQLKVRVTPEERAMIEAKMAQLGTTNMGAYLRKMAIDGYVVKLDLPELRELVSLLRYSSNNLNQLTRRVHETGRVYAADMEDILQNQERIWQAASGILSRLAAPAFLWSGILAGQGSFLYAEIRNKQNWRDIDMRFLLKILFAPILAVLAVVSWFLVFVVGLSSGILCIPAAILGFFGLFILFVDSVSYGVGLLVIAFLISPYGLPMLAGWLVAKLHVLRYMLRDWIYG